MHQQRPITKHVLILFLCALIGPIASCTNDAFNNLTSPTSNFAPNAQRVPRAIQVAFVNNTPFRAIFTFGAYDPFDKDTVPLGANQLRLEGNTSSAQLAEPCMQVFSVGGDELIRLLKLNENDPTINITDPRALIRGVNFSSAPLGDPLEAEPTEGTADGVVERSGVNFTCLRTDIRQTTGSGLLIFTFEQDAAALGGFRIDFAFFEP